MQDKITQAMHMFRLTIISYYLPTTLLFGDALRRNPLKSMHQFIPSQSRVQNMQHLFVFHIGWGNEGKPVFSNSFPVPRLSFQNFFFSPHLNFKSNFLEEKPNFVLRCILLKLWEYCEVRRASVESYTRKLCFGSIKSDNPIC